MIVPLNEFDFLKRALAVYPNKPAVVCGKHRLNYAELGRRSNRFANAMRSFGVKKGDRVAILSQNCHRMLEAFFGNAQAGVVSMPMNFRLIPSDFDYILNHGGAKVLIVESGLEKLIEPIRGGLSTVERFLSASDQSAPPAGWDDYEQAISAAASDPPDPVDTDENETSALLYTSGTTGRPKGVMLTHRNLFMNAINSIIEFGLQAGDNYLHGIAMFHCNGWGLPYAVTGVGGTHIVLKKFDPEIVFARIAEERVSAACMAPTMINMLLNHSDTLRLDMPRDLRVGTAGSAPPMALIKALQERFGWRVIQVYGLTETSPFLTVSKTKPHMADWPDEEKYRVQTRTGYPMIGVDLRVVDDAGNDVEPNGEQTGEVLARSNVIMSGYWNQPEATDAVVVDGWLHTGDMATIDNEGYIEVVDRKKDLIITGGENVSSIEVEGVLYKHPGVLEAAVVGVPDERWGEAPKALIVLKANARATEEEIIEFCRERLAHYKCPKSVEFVESVPRTATGKIQKAVIREKYWQGREKRV
ncbi:MAG TPA: fatty acid--CoA ligase [Blastocatellia bacterium]|nr:fatty acid--CoA ligase [Blastocatellia bacterium]